jgi:hypothetical protein
LLGQLGTFGELGQAGSFGFDVLEDGGVGRANVIEARRRQSLGDPGHDLLERTAKKNPDVRACVSRLAGEDLPLLSSSGA